MTYLDLQLRLRHGERGQLRGRIVGQPGGRVEPRRAQPGGGRRQLGDQPVVSVGELGDAIVVAVEAADPLPRILGPGDDRVRVGAVLANQPGELREPGIG